MRTDVIHPPRFWRFWRYSEPVFDEPAAFVHGEGHWVTEGGNFCFYWNWIGEDGKVNWTFWAFRKAEMVNAESAYED